MKKILTLFILLFATCLFTGCNKGKNIIKCKDGSSCEVEYSIKYRNGKDEDSEEYLDNEFLMNQNVYVHVDFKFINPQKNFDNKVINYVAKIENSKSEISFKLIKGEYINLPQPENIPIDVNNLTKGYYTVFKPCEFYVKKDVQAYLYRFVYSLNATPIDGKEEYEGKFHVIFTSETDGKFEAEANYKFVESKDNYDQGAGMVK